MADFIIKPTSGNLILKDDQNVARMTVAPTSGLTTLSNQVFPAGHVLQCLSVSKLDTFSHSGNTTYTTVTGLTQAITPSSSSNTAQQRAALHLKNESGTFYFYHFLFPTFTQYLDAPATTSPVTYGIQVRIADSTGAGTSDTAYVNYQGTDSNNAQHGRGASSFTVWEISA